jgi:threonyl-tRNA synthetase
MAEDAAVPVVAQATAKFAVLDILSGAAGREEEPATTAANETPPSAATSPVPQQQQPQQQPGRRTLASSGPQITSADGSKKIGGDSYTGRIANPVWLQHRAALFDQVQTRRAAELATKIPVAISVTLPDGTVLVQDKKTGTPFQAWETTPLTVATMISQGLADAAAVARVTYSSLVADYSLSEDGMDGVDAMEEAMGEHQIVETTDGADGNSNNNMTFLWDMTRPLVGTVAKLEFLKFDDHTDAKTVFWHSSAHIMGEALEHAFGSKLTIGPPLAGGFYYDSYMGTASDGAALTAEDCTYLHVLVLIDSCVYIDIGLVVV